jgi:diaminopimelate epimerase
MQYFNSDGEESTMCGNGGRCIAHLAHKLSLTSDVVSFEAIDGLHTAIIEGDMVKLGMNDVSKIKINEQNDYVLNTGSPHYVHFCNSNELNHIVSFGKQIRYNEEYKKEGINVNMVNTIDEQSIEVATYERGVEDETYSCGTGVTAAAIAYSKANNKSSPIYIKTKGGDLIVHFDIEDNTYINVILEGPATYVFEGQVTI